MKRLLWVTLLSLATGSVMAQSQRATIDPSLGPDIRVQKRLLGSGDQTVDTTNAYTNAKQVGDYGVYHAPQFMPGYPTAATIWPRVVDVACRGDLCDGYDWSPAYGRGEYVFVRAVQVVQAAPPPLVITPQPLPAPERQIRKPLRE